MEWNLSDYLDAASRGIKTLSNPSQSAIVAAGAAGVFSAEFNKARIYALDHLTIPSLLNKPTFANINNQIFGRLRNTLQGGGSGAIPAGPSGKILGLTYFQAILIGVGALLVGIFMLGRRTG